MNIKRNVMTALLLVPFLSHNTAMCQRLTVGEKAPNFEAVDSNGNIIKLEDYKGQKILVAFFRYVGCPVCNFRIHELIENYDNIRSKGYKIIAIYESDNTTLNDYLSENPVPFTVIGNPNLKLYKMYRVEKSIWNTLGSAFNKQTKKEMKKGSELFSKKYKRDGNLTRIPADFLIDENGILKVVHYGNNIGDHLPIAAILNN